MRLNDEQITQYKNKLETFVKDFDELTEDEKTCKLEPTGVFTFWFHLGEDDTKKVVDAIKKAPYVQAVNYFSFPNLAPSFVIKGVLREDSLKEAIQTNPKIFYKCSIDNNYFASIYPEKIKEKNPKKKNIWVLELKDNGNIEDCENGSKYYLNNVVGDKDALDEYIKRKQQEQITILENLEEDIEIHHELNPKIWTEDKELIPEVRAKILQIVDKFKNLLSLDNVDLKVEDIYLLGSNANFNYNEDSDLDVHIIADESFDCSEEHLNTIYNCYKSLFNNKYDIRIRGINVELYVENKDKLSNISNGVYSLNKGWIKDPAQYKIPEFDQIAVDKGVKYWEDKYFDITLDPTITKIDNYIDSIYDLRKESIQKEGEFGEGNLIFKEIRRLGYLDDLKELKVVLTSKELSLEGLNEAKEESLEDKIRSVIAHKETDDWHDGKAYLFEVSDESKNSNNGDIDPFWIQKFDNDEVDFSKLRIYSRTPEEKEDGKYIATFMISGGKNGSGDWTEYLDKLADAFKALKEKTGAEPLLYKIDTDICDDVWTGYVFLYDHEDKVQESLNEDLIVIEPEEGKKKIEELKAQIENCDNPKVRKSLLTLMNIYLFQTYKPSDRENSTLTDDEWQKIADWHTEETKKHLEEELWPKTHEVVEDSFETEEVMNAKVKDWLAAEHPTEFQIEAIPEDLTWGELIEKIKNPNKEGPEWEFNLDTEPREWLWQRACELYYLQTGEFLDADFERLYKEKRTDLQTPEEKVEGKEMLMTTKPGVPEDGEELAVEEPLEEARYRPIDFDLAADYLSKIQKTRTIRSLINLNNKIDSEYRLGNLSKESYDRLTKASNERSYQLVENLDEMLGEKIRFKYYGPVYHFQHVVADDWEAYTEAISEIQALNNLIFKAKKQFGYEPSSRITLDIDCLEVSPKEGVIVSDATCEICGRRLNDNGECPLCDLGDETVLEETLYDKLLAKRNKRKE